jgi:CheY-specific phosphatase CheX
MDISPEQIAEIKNYLNEIVVNVGELTFEIGFCPTNLSSFDSQDKTNNTYSSQVHILGDWNGCVKISISQNLTHDTALKIFDLSSASELTFFHIQQFLNEFVNMIGGNIKPFLGEQCALSVPKTIEAVGFRQNEPQSTEIIEVDFACNSGGYLSVQVFEFEPDLKNEVQSILNEQ